MFPRINFKRLIVSLLPVLFVLAVIVAACVTLCHPHCRERMVELAIDGVLVGVIISSCRVIHVLHQRGHERATFFSLWCFARIALGVEIRYGLVGGFLLGVIRGVIECLYLGG